MTTHDFCDNSSIKLHAMDALPLDDWGLTPELIEAGVQTTTMSQSARGSQTPCLSALMLPPDLRIPVVARMLLKHPDASCRELALRASIAGGGLPDWRISFIQFAFEAIAYGQCQILRLVRDHYAAIAGTEAERADLADQASRTQLRMLLSRPVGCIGGSDVPLLDLQTLPATDIEVIDARTALIGQRMGFSQHSEPRVLETRAESLQANDADEEVVYVVRSSPASPDADSILIESVSENDE